MSEIDDKIKSAIDYIKSQIEDNTLPLEVIVGCDFFLKLSRHPTIVLTKKCYDVFGATENYSTWPCRKNGKKVWKVTGLETGKVVYFKRTERMWRVLNELH